MELLKMKQNIPVYADYLYEEEKSENTIKKYTRNIKKFIDYSEGEIKISKKLLIKYKGAIAEKYKINSANTMFVALNKYFEYLGENEFRIKLLKSQKNLFIEESQCLQRKDYVKLVDTARKNKKSNLALIMQTICSTGIRVSELKYISVESLKKGKIEVNLKGKTRVIFLPKKLVMKLEKYSKRKRIKSGSIFKTRNNNAVDRSNIWKDMKKLGKEAGVDESKIYPHNLRHLFATTYYETEKDILRLADILGHSSMETTRIYTKVTSAEYERGVSSLNLVYG